MIVTFPSSESQSQSGKSRSGAVGWLMEIALQNKEKKCILLHQWGYVSQLSIFIMIILSLTT